MRLPNLTTVSLVTVLALAAAPAFAQSGASQSPPAPNSSASAPEPSNSLPAGSATLTPGAPQTGNVASTGIGGAPGAVPQASPALPSNSTGNGQPSGAFQQTVPQPAK